MNDSVRVLGELLARLGDGQLEPGVHTRLRARYEQSIVSTRRERRAAPRLGAVVSVVGCAAFAGALGVLFVLQSGERHEPLRLQAPAATAPAGSGPRNSGPERTPFSAPPITGALMDLDEFGRLTAKATYVVLSRCMSKSGFRWLGSDRFQPDPKTVGPFGFESVNDVRTAQGETSVPSLAETPQAQLPRGYAEALLGSGATITVTSPDGKLTAGIPADGCTAESERRIHGDPVAHERAVLAMLEKRDESETRLTRSARIRELNHQWSACMSARGFAFESPVQLVHMTELPKDPAFATGQPVSADLACKAETNYLAQAYAEWTEIELALLKASPGLLDEWARRLAISKANAEDVIARRG